MALVSNELLAFVQHVVNTMDEDSIVQLCRSTYTSEEICKGRLMLYEALGKTAQMTSRRRDGSERSLQDIIFLLKQTNPAELPVFVAKQLHTLPAVSTDHVNLLQKFNIMRAELDEMRGRLDASESTIKLNASIKREKIVEICEGCGQKIQDRYLMRVGELSWHEHCLSCCVCGCPLAHTCYTRNAKLYCKPDYDRLFGVKCTRCGDRLLPQEMVMRAQQYVFHIQCFVCVMCCQPLQKGEQYVIRAGQIFCRQDFEKEMYLMQHAEDDMIIDDSERPRDGRRGPKRPRTILTSAQRRQFKASFEVSPKPCRKVREALAKDTGLSVRVVQVWFQNQRAKMKKIQRKAKQEGDKNGDKDKDKDEKSIKQESPSSEHGNYLGLDASYSASSQPLNPNLPYSPDDYPAHSGDSFCSSDISLDGSNFDQLDEGTSDTMSLQNLEVPHHPHQHTPHGSHEPLNLGTGAVVNPIDKLYLMQNSYFSTDH